MCWAVETYCKDVIVKEARRKGSPWRKECKSCADFPSSYPILVDEKASEGAVSQLDDTSVRKEAVKQEVARVRVLVTSHFKRQRAKLDAREVGLLDSLSSYHQRRVSEIDVASEYTAWDLSEKEQPVLFEVNDDPTNYSRARAQSAVEERLIFPSLKRHHAVFGGCSSELHSLSLKTFERTTAANNFTTSISDCAVTGDGLVAVSASTDGSARVLDLDNNGQLLSTYSGHTDAVNCVVLTHDETRAITGSSDCSVHIWNISSAEKICELDGHDDWVYSCAVSQDDRMIVSASADQTLRVWDLEARETLQLLTGHSSAVLCCSLTADGSRVVSGSRDKTARVWDTVTGATLAVFRGHSDWILCCTLLGNDAGLVVATGSADSTVKLWDANNATEVSTLTGHRSWVSSVTVAENGTKLLSVAEDKTLKIWDVQGAELSNSVALDSVPMAVAVPQAKREIIRPSVLATSSRDAFTYQSSSIRKLQLATSPTALLSRSFNNLHPKTPRALSSSLRSSSPISRSTCSLQRSMSSYRSSDSSDNGYSSAGDVMSSPESNGGSSKSFGRYLGLKIARTDGNYTTSRPSPVTTPRKSLSLKKFRSAHSKSSTDDV
uniref:Uncharacterized protein n=1 Tax=Tetraselmis chuii TaxID=63592 RepID=A0A7S1SYF2_9CHLO|mmetsp:Transcript_35050/g.62498  ORF Transcript_35050/g.62498 Transcript_35050/m.62498 type:complete len:607 (+) Transcript_35050:521-2341(+)|eukprot:CAMPEP_0177757316 /NCGR_PEP_ID=MMETSP0491_2-20121128/3576_1 /TAXON_ID=63592 /ORGANISM="Tetraselmis chuii, Strain PLY429" /LENGTH=606 /DNA_ID=CAMNT_0019272955 /DNA_START=1980 /DNA_END=3800 /DNA_ORIENTATION=+